LVFLFNYYEHKKQEKSFISGIVLKKMDFAFRMNR
jgi:hypothetical protein